MSKTNELKKIQQTLKNKIAKILNVFNTIYDKIDTKYKSR